MENLIFCTHPNYFKGTISDAHSNIPKWIIRYLRKTFLTAADKKIEKHKKIYIDRSDSRYNHCKIINVPSLNTGSSSNVTPVTVKI